MRPPTPRTLRRHQHQELVMTGDPSWAITSHLLVKAISILVSVSEAIHLLCPLPSPNLICTLSQKAAVREHQVNFISCVLAQTRGPAPADDAQAGGLVLHRLSTQPRQRSPGRGFCM